MTESTISVRDLHVSYGELQVVAGLNFDVAPGEIISLLGASGSGKSTILRAIAGFVPPEKGQIRIQGRPVSDGDREHIPPEKRGLGMMFQDYALFPYLTVAENVGFGLRNRPDAARRIEELLGLVGLGDYADRKPSSLSGGQQQRVALMRALAPRPNALLLDEPFANLDGPLRREIGAEVRRILKHEGISGILVTHDRQEALSLSDRVGVLGSQTADTPARLLQLATPESVYGRPTDPMVATLTGQAYQLPGACSAGQAETALGLIACDESLNGRAILLVRPHQLSFREDSGGEGTITDSAFVGPGRRYSVETRAGTFSFDDERAFEIGEHGVLSIAGICHGWPED